MVLSWGPMKRFVDAVEAFEASSSDAYALALMKATADVGRYVVELAPVDVLLAEWKTCDLMVDKALRSGDADAADALAKMRDREAFATAEKIVRRLKGDKQTPLERQLRASVKRIEETRGNVVPLRVRDK